MNVFPDIYFSPSWGKLHEAKDNGAAEVFLFENSHGSVYYQFVKRPIETSIAGESYFDIVTPYGFNGPIVLKCKEDTKEQLVQEWSVAFNDYCLRHNIIAEYVRFSPWLKNYLDFSRYYQLVFNNYTLAVNLEVEDFFTQEFSSMRRKNVRKSMRSNVLIEFDFEGNSLDAFYRLYNITAIRNKISEYYQISLEFTKQNFAALKDNIFIINAALNGTYISSAIFLHYGDYLHYHFCGNDHIYFPLCANSYILYEACRWGKEQGKKRLHLGGSANGHNLYDYKKQFTQDQVYDFYVGKSIRNHRIYEELVRLNGNNTKYFPAYRTSTIADK